MEIKKTTPKECCDKWDGWKTIYLKKYLECRMNRSLRDEIVFVIKRI